MKSKGTQTKRHYRQIVEQNSSPISSANSSRKTTESVWRMISNNWLPTNISSHVDGIQNDLREGTTQISEL
jgi:hypothetical protein